MEEQWEDIDGYGGLYKINQYGIVIKTNPKKIMIPRIDQGGYVVIRLYKNNKTKTHRMARLIALAFIPNPENKPTVNHKNGNKRDDSIENLEWMTYSENSQHAYDTGLIKQPSGKEHFMWSKHHSAQTRRKMSEIASGVGNPFYGKHHSDETRRKISDKTRGKNNPNYGKKLSEEAKMKMSVSRKGKKLSPEHKEQIRLGNLRRWAKVREQRLASESA